MYCSGCGQALVAGQGFCPRCGQVNAMGVPPVYVPMPPWAVVERRVDSLAIAWLVYAGLAALTGMIGLAFAHAAMNGGMGGPWMHGRWHNGPVWPFFFLRLGWVALAVRVGLAVAAGYGLLHKTSWGRWVAIVAGVISLIHLPLGTVMGIWTLVVLLNAPNAAGYEAMVRG